MVLPQEPPGRPGAVGAPQSALRAPLALLAALALFAVAAPLVCLDRPFLLYVPAAAASGGFGQLPAGFSMPWFTALFDTRLFPGAVDLVCNGTLALLPAAAGIALALCRRRPRAALLALALAPLLGSLLAAAAAHKEPMRDYSTRVAELRDRGAFALFPPAALDPNRTDIAAAMEPPSRRHWLGTDQAGRDVAARLLYGARVSLAVGIASVAAYVLAGVVLGLLAGTYRGSVEWLVLRAIEVVSCFPSFLLVMVLIAVLRERSLGHLIAIIALAGWPTVARLVRAEVLRLRALEFAVAAEALGLPRLRIAFRHLLPNALAPVLVTAAFGVPGAILVESGLAFLGLGDPLAASWGQVLRAGRDTGELRLILAPGLLILATVTMMNVLGARLRDHLDPRHRSAPR